ncbi:MAG: right-handed parallel beta-helix repeat-containing protein [Planctomycetota bacterium]
MALWTTLRGASLGLVLAASAGHVPAASAQQSGETIRERVVVTLPNGRRIVRWVEKPAPQPAAVTAPAAGSPSGSDPFTSPGDGSSIAGNTPTGGGDAGGLPEAYALWYEYFRNGDTRADVNGDGRVNSSDYFAFVTYITRNGGWSPTDTLGPDTDGDGFGDGRPQNDEDAGSSDSGNPGSDDGDSQGDAPDAGGEQDETDSNSGGGNPGSNGDSGMPDDPAYESTGWTEFTASADTRKVYVSERGSDSNDGLSPNSAVRTIDRGKDLMRDGYPDWLLLKAGDTFREAIGGWNISGRSADEPMLISSYGDGPRPKLITGTGRAVSIVSPRFNRHHVAFVGLHMEPGVLGSGTGFHLVTSTIKDLLIEDCYIGGYEINISIDTEARESKMRDVRIRRNVIADGLGSAFSFGIYAESIVGLLIEENFIDRNGWDFRAGRNATATMFGHNIYIQRSARDVTVRGNIITRASAHGLQLRHGGVIEGNVFAENAIGLLFSNQELNEPRATDRVVHNLVVDGVHVNDNERRSWGVHISNVKQVRVAENIIANSEVSDPDAGFGLLLTGADSSYAVRGATVENNVVHDFGEQLRIFNEIARDVTLRNNTLSKSDGNKSVVYVRENAPLPGVRFEGNAYRHDDDDSPFELGSRDLTLAQWRAEFDSQAREAPAYVDGDRDMDSYARSLGFSNADGMYESMRTLSRRTWDERLTSAAIRGYFREGFAPRP